MRLKPRRCRGGAGTRSSLQGSIVLPPGAREEDITASYKDGVLEVRAPAPATPPEPTTRKIRIDHS
jgi:HSP20 family protein